MDTKGEYPTNKFNGNIVLEGEAAVKFKSEIDAIIASERFKNKNPRLPYKTNKDGQFEVVARTSKRPAMFDSKNRPVPADTEVGGGTVMRIHVGPYNYGDGLSLTLYSVQIKDLKLRGDRVPFEPEDDGYTVDDIQDTSGPFETSGADLDI